MRDWGSKEWGGWECSLPFRHPCIGVASLCGSEGDEMPPRTECIINGKICFSTELNKLPMIWLSERWLAWIREANGSHGGRYSPTAVDSWTLSTVGWLWWRKPGPLDFTRLSRAPSPEHPGSWGSIPTGFCLGMKPWRQIHEPTEESVGGFPVRDIIPSRCAGRERWKLSCAWTATLKVNFESRQWAESRASLWWHLVMRENTGEEAQRVWREPTASYIHTGGLLVREGGIET